MSRDSSARRVPFCRQVALAATDAVPKVYLARDLSTRAVFVYADEPKALGAQLQLRAELEPGVPLRIAGRVIRTQSAGPLDRSGFVVAFEAISPELTLRLQRFVAAARLPLSPLPVARDDCWQGEELDPCCCVR